MTCSLARCGRVLDGQNLVEIRRWRNSLAAARANIGPSTSWSRTWLTIATGVNYSLCDGPVTKPNRPFGCAPCCAMPASTGDGVTPERLSPCFKNPSSLSVTRWLPIMPRFGVIARFGVDLRRSGT